MSLRGRLTLLTALIFAGCLVIVAVAVPRLVRESLMDRLDDDIDDTSLVAVDALGGDIGLPRGPGGGPDHSPLSNAAYAEVREADGAVIKSQFLDSYSSDRTPPVLPADLQAAHGEPFTVPSVGGEDPARWRVTVYEITIRERSLARVSERPGLLVVALPTSEVDATTKSVVKIVWITSAMSIVVVLLIAWLVVGLGLRPLRRMERSAASITDAADLGQRVEHPSERTELGKLGSTINGMLGRLESSFADQQATEERLRRFAADASHELRTPLTSIRGYAELYRRGGDEPDQVRRSMGRIEHEAERMGNLVDDLLLLARADAELPLERHPFDLRAVVEGLAADARVVEPDRAITVAAEPCTIVGDRHRLTQAVANVITNARVHTPAGTPIELTLRVTPPPLPTPGTPAGSPRAELAVIDHGGGLPPEQLDKVFERFYRADAARTRERGGSGLGLSITAAIISAHGGEVAARPTPGGGATFTLSIPLAGPPRARDTMDATSGAASPPVPASMAETGGPLPEVGQPANG
jgi:two-component system OmpR family sensor kinase